MKNIKTKKLTSDKKIYYVILTLISLLIIFPYLWLIFTSFDKFNSYSLPYPPRLIPKNPSIFNYKMALINVPVLRYLFNTVVIIILSLSLNVIISTLTGFVLSKGRFPGKNLILIFILSNMMVPFETKIMPVYNVIKTLGLSDTYLGVVLPSVMTNAFFIFFVKKFTDGIPDSLYEAAVIDGANKFRIYLQIFVPLMKPIIATIVVLDVINVWNDLLWPMIVISSSDLRTIQLGLAVYNTGAMGVPHAGILTALSILSIIPLAIVFIFMQKYIVQSIASSGMKN